MNFRRLTTLVMSLLLLTSSAFGQQHPSSDDKPGFLWRTVLAVGGGFGGAMLGWRLLDDDRHSTNTVLTTMALAGAGGAVGGFFLGRELDRKAYRWAPDELNRALLRHQWRQGHIEGVAPLRLTGFEAVRKDARPAHPNGGQGIAMFEGTRDSEVRSQESGASSQ